MVTVRGEAIRRGASLLGGTEAEEGEAIEPHGAVSAQRLPDARLKLFRLWGMYRTSIINNDVDFMQGGRARVIKICLHY